MLKNMSLRTKLSLMIATALFVIVAVSYRGLSGVSTMNDTVGQIVNENVPRIMYADDISICALQMQRAEKNHILNSEAKDLERREANFQKYQNECKKWIEKAEVVVSERNKPKIARVKTILLEEYPAIAKEIFAFSRQNKKAEARELSNKGRTLIDEAQKLTDEMVEYNKEQLSIKFEQSKTSYENIRNLILAFSLVGLGALVAIALFVSNIILSSLNSVQNGLDSFFRFLRRETTKTELIGLNSKDEFGQISKMIDGNIVGLEQAISSERHAALTIQKSIDLLSSGNLNSRIVESFDNKLFDSIATSFNTALANVENLISELNEMSQYVRNGDLKKRVDSSDLKGGWKEIALSINNMLDIIYEAIMNDSVQTLIKISEGDLTARITTEYKGDYDLFKKTVNKLAEQLQDVVINIKNSGAQIASASLQVSATGQSLSNSATQMASNLEETASATEQMTSSISQNAQNAKSTSSMAMTVNKMAQESGDAVNQTVEAMQEIANKISVIQDIAYKTNLLALNAAIEAARAGEHGRGFAVVASEVRKLAERSQSAAKEIGKITTDSVKISERAGALIQEMVPQIRQTAELIQEIAAASSEQDTGISQINSAMRQLDQVTQENSSGSEELASTAEELSAQAGQLMQMMEYFDVGDNRGGRLLKIASRSSGGR